MEQALLCSDCFNDEGLKLDAFQIGIEQKGKCVNCNSTSGRKLNEYLINELAFRFFVMGSRFKTQYGGAPLIQFNEYQKTSVKFPKGLNSDAKLITKIINVGFFHYGPRLWTIGEVGPLKLLQLKSRRNEVIEKIIVSYPTRLISEKEKFYRIRKNPKNPNSHLEYDSAPKGGNGRFDSNKFPVLYASPDLELCIHECRATIEDAIYIATLIPNKELKLLDLTEFIKEDATEFESINITIHMLHSASTHSYEILRALGKAAKKAGFDGLIYASYFNSVRSGTRSRFPICLNANNDATPNIALFGRPIKTKKVKVKCINRLFLKNVEYEVEFGPANFN